MIVCDHFHSVIKNDAESAGPLIHSVFVVKPRLLTYHDCFAVYVMISKKESLSLR